MIRLQTGCDIFLCHPHVQSIRLYPNKVCPTIIKWLRLHQNKDKIEKINGPKYSAGEYVLYSMSIRIA